MQAAKQTADVVVKRFWNIHSGNPPNKQEKKKLDKLINAKIKGDKENSGCRRGKRRHSLAATLNFLHLN